MSRQKENSYEFITGRLILNPEAKGDEDEDDEGDDEIQWLDSREMEGVARGASLIKASGLPTKNVSVKPHGTDRKVTVQGRFPLCGPWWEAKIKVSKTKGPVRFMVKLPFYKLCQDPDVSTVSLFLTQGCNTKRDNDKVKNQECNTNVKHFIDTMYQNGVKLNFRNLEDALDQYGGLKKEYQGPAQEIKSRIHKTGEGRCVLRALKFPKLLWYLPNLLPKQAYNLLTSLEDEKLELELLEEAIQETPWVFGFSPTLRWMYNLVGCEASVDALNYCNLLSKMPSYIQDALYIYHVMKSDCQRLGHTFLYENSMKKSQAFQGYHVKEWEEAYTFLEDKYIIVRDKNRIYLQKYWKYEQRIADNLASLQSRNSWRINFDWQNHPDFQSDAEQRKAARMICENPITVISGKGGCGKTHVVSTVFEEAAKEFLHRENAAKEKGSSEGDKKKNKEVGTILSQPYILLTAPTGKAASLLGRESKLPSFTLHQVLFSFYNYIRMKSDPTIPEELKEWKFKVANALIVDECSLVSVEVFASVLDILMRESELCKIVFLGDIEQLPSINPGNFLSDLYSSYNTIGWSVSLLTNHRAESALIIDNATRITKQQQPHFDSARGFHDVRIRGCHTDEEEESFEVDDAIRELLKLEDPSLKDHERSQFIAFTRKDCDRINEICCQHYSKHTTNCKKRLDFRKGDKVCMTRNAEVFNMIKKEDVRLCNGEIFFIEDYVDKINERNEKTAEVTLREGERTLRVDFREVRKKCKVKHSWAKTIHTFQGSESETVVYVVGCCPFQNWQHVYTAVTRGKNQVYIVSSLGQLKTAINKKPPMRNTRLYELLAEKLRGRGGVKVPSGQSSSDVMKGHSSMLVQSAMVQNGTSSYGKPDFTDTVTRSDTSDKAKAHWSEEWCKDSSCGPSQVKGEVSCIGQDGASTSITQDITEGESQRFQEQWDKWSDNFIAEVFRLEDEIHASNKECRDTVHLEDDNSLTNQNRVLNSVSPNVYQVQQAGHCQPDRNEHFKNTSPSKSVSKVLFDGVPNEKINKSSKSELQLSSNAAHQELLPTESESEDVDSENDLSTMTSPMALVGSDKGESSSGSHQHGLSAVDQLQSQLSETKIVSPSRTPKRSCSDSEMSSPCKLNKYEF